MDGLLCMCPFYLVFNHDATESNFQEAPGCLSKYYLNFQHQSKPPVLILVKGPTVIGLEVVACAPSQIQLSIHKKPYERSQTHSEGRGFPCDCAETRDKEIRDIP